jgi:hypothetical protein
METDWPSSRRGLTVSEIETGWPDRDRGLYLRMVTGWPGGATVEDRACEWK